MILCNCIVPITQKRLKMETRRTEWKICESNIQAFTDRQGMMITPPYKGLHMSSSPLRMM